MTDKTRKYHDALDDALDRPVAYNPAFKRITGSTVAGILLSQAWYWSKRHKEQEGWFWKSQKEWEEETGLTRSEQETARRHCIRVGAIEEQLKGVPATLHYRVNKQKIYELLGVQFAEIPQTENDQTKQSEPAEIPQSSFPANSQNARKQQSGIPSNFNKESKTSSRIPPEREGAPNFEDMSPVQARKLKPLQIWEKATGTFPGALLWESVYDTILNHNITVEKLRQVAIAWQGRGYKPSNVTGILEWAVHGIPEFVKPGAQAGTPAGFHLPKPNVVCGQGGRLYDKCKETYGTDGYEAALNQFRIHVSGCRLCGDASNSNQVLGELNDLTKRMTTS